MKKVLLITGVILLAVIAAMTAMAIVCAIASEEQEPYTK
jgi:hypothetical protein